MADNSEFVADSAAGVSPAAKKGESGAGPQDAFGGGGSAFAHLTEDAGTTRELLDDDWSIGWSDIGIARGPSSELPAVWVTDGAGGGTLVIGGTDAEGDNVPYAWLTGGEMGAFNDADNTRASVRSSGQVISKSATGDATLVAGGTNLWEVLGNGGGVIAHSADGTGYKLVPPNGGGAAAWVAA